MKKSGPPVGSPHGTLRGERHRLHGRGAVGLVWLIDVNQQIQDRIDRLSGWTQLPAYI